MSTHKSEAATCPDPAVLRDFLNDALAAEDAAPVQAHVDACPACQQSLGELVGGLPEPVVEFGLQGARHGLDDTVRSPQSAREVAPGEIPLVPGYEVLKELGRGGMGVVYQARQLRPDRIVALKMLLAGRHAGPKERARFLREAEAAAHLQHPNIVALYEAGQHGDLPYFTLEFIEGGTLAHQLLGGPLEADAAARLVEQVARGMHYAHERGIVHRDLKPANILLQRKAEIRNPKSETSPKYQNPKDQNSNRPVSDVGNSKLGLVSDFGFRISDFDPKISDFGLAKNLAEAAALTSTGAIFGTPSYMAPEQASGDIKRVGASADVYALGAVLYECLTGLPPFRGLTPADTVLQVLRSDPSPPSTLQRSVPRDLDTICLKCLEKEPHRRYASALDLADDLRRFQAGEPIRARPVGRGERLVKWCRRHPAVAALAATIVLLILTAGALVTWQWREAVTANRDLQESNVQLESARTDADIKRQQAEEEKQIAQAVTNFLHELLQQASPTEQADRLLALGDDRFKTSENPTVKELLDRTAAEVTPDKIEQKFPRQPLVQAAILRTVGSTYHGVGDFTRAISHLERAQAIYKAKRGLDHPDTLSNMNDLARAYLNAGHVKLALPLLEDTLKRRKAVLGPDHPDTLESMNSLALGYNAVGKLDLALPLCEETLKLRKLKLGPNHPDTVISMNNLAVGYHVTGKQDLALSLFEQALKLTKARLGPDHPHTLSCMNILAEGYRSANKLDLALPLLEDTLKRMKAKFGADHPNTLLCMYSLAEGYRTANKLDLAMPLFEDTLKRMKVKLGPDQRATLSCMANLAEGYRSTKKLDLALPLYEEMLKLRKAKFAPDDPDTLTNMYNLALSYQDAGKLNLALPLFEESLKLRKAKLGPDHVDTLLSMNSLALCYQAARKLDLAIPLYKETLTLMKAKLGPDHHQTLLAMNSLALGYHDAGKLDLAIPLYEDTLKLMKANLGPDHQHTRNCMNILVSACIEAKQGAKVVPVVEAFVAGQRTRLGAKDARFAEALEWAGTSLLQAGRFLEAEPFLRECLTLRAKAVPDTWVTCNTKALLGGSLLGQKKYADAEPLLWDGYQGMKKQEAKVSEADKARLTDAEGRLADLVEATRKKTETKLTGKLTDAAKEVVHEVKLTAGQPAVILMRSDQFDTYLRLEDAKGKILAENDDIDAARKNHDSRILYVPAADGVYRIVATSFEQAGRGGYDIVVREYRGSGVDGKRPSAEKK